MLIHISVPLKKCNRFSSAAAAVILTEIEKPWQKLTALTTDRFRIVLNWCSSQKDLISANDFSIFFYYTCNLNRIALDSHVSQTNVIGLPFAKLQITFLQVSNLKIDEILVYFLSRAIFYKVSSSCKQCNKMKSNKLLLTPFLNFVYNVTLNELKHTFDNNGKVYYYKRDKNREKWIYFKSINSFQNVLSPINAQTFIECNSDKQYLR